MRTVVMISFLTLSVVACSGVDPKSKVDPETGLNEGQKGQMKTINTSFDEVNEAIQLAWGSGASPLASEKVNKMVALLKGADCVRTYRAPSDVYDRDWSGVHEIKGNTCPIYLYQYSQFSKTTNEWAYLENFQVKANEFAALSTLQSVQSEGLLRAEKNGVRTKIVGEVKYTNFRVKDIGPLALSLRTSQEYIGERGGGSLTFLLEARRKFKHTLLVSWNLSKDSPTYRLNGREIDQLAFDEMFSAYKLTEMIDRSKKMR